ncbi:pre-mRNA-splicing factor SYF1 [Trichonephila clavipes]|nr:pre-mRNA-splicing factor SYF1 [Trichonephila clavipes]
MIDMSSFDSDKKSVVVEDEDIPYEEEILRNPYSVKHWLRYIEFKKEAPKHVINLLYERALRELPGSYTADFKLNAVEKANEVGNREAARFFNVVESNIRLWRRNKTNFENCDRRKRADRRGKPH